MSDPGVRPKNGRASIRSLLTGLPIWESAGPTSGLSANHPSFGTARRRIQLWRLTPSRCKSAKSLILTLCPTPCTCGPPAHILKSPQRVEDKVSFPLWTQWTKWTEWPIVSIRYENDLALFPPLWGMGVSFATVATIATVVFRGSFLRSFQNNPFLGGYR